MNRTQIVFIILTIITLVICVASSGVSALMYKASQTLNLDGEWNYEFEVKGGGVDTVTFLIIDDGGDKIFSREPNNLASKSTVWQVVSRTSNSLVAENTEENKAPGGSINGVERKSYKSIQQISSSDGQTLVIKLRTITKYTDDKVEDTGPIPLMKLTRKAQKE